MEMQTVLVTKLYSTYKDCYMHFKCNFLFQLLGHVSATIGSLTRDPSVIWIDRRPFLGLY